MARTGHGGIVLIGGEAGIGKTTLARQLCDAAVEHGDHVLVGQADQLIESPPYGPWIDLLSRGPDPEDGTEPPFLATESADAQATNVNALFASVLRYLDALVADRPVLILLEDFHWADPASVDLLRFISRDLDRMALLVLVTYRADELPRDHPLSLQLPSLVRQSGALRIDLRRLQLAEMRELVRWRYSLADADEKRLVDYLDQRSEGNPLYVEELLRALEQERVLTSDGSNLRLADLSRIRVPALLRQIIDERALQLGERTRELLATASVIGPDVSLSIWSRVSDTPEDELIDVLGMAVDARLLEADPDGTSVRFAHSMIREALYEGILAPRRRLRHRRVAEALIEMSNPDPDAVAFHLQRAGDPRAAQWLIRAGVRAQRTYALLTAADRFDAALALLESRDESIGERAELMYRIARMRRYADPRGSLHYLDDAIAAAGDAGDEVMIAYMRCFRGGLLCAVGELRRGLDEFQSGLDRIATLSTEERGRLRALQQRLGEPPDEYQFRGAFANWLAVSGRASEAIVEGRRVVETEPAPGVGTSSHANAWRALASAHALMGSPEEARRACEMASREYQSVEHPYQFGNSRLLELFEVVLPYQTDDLDGRQRLAREAEEAWTRASGATIDLPPRFVWLPLLLIEGEWREARELAEAARNPTGRRSWRPLATTMLATIATHQGDSEYAWRLIHEQLPGGPETLPGDGIFLDVAPLQRLAARLLIDSGELDAALKWLESNDRWLEWSGALLGRAEGHLAWAEYLRAVGRVDESMVRARNAFEAASDPRQPLTLIATQRLLGELETAAGRLESARDWLDYALDLSERCQARFEKALTLVAHAELDLARGLASPNGHLNPAIAILDELGARPAAARAQRLANRSISSDSRPPAGLTARELEVLRLVADGRTDREIADQLFISPRTVTTHISRILTKLDVGSRTAAAAFALREGII
jgi:DNA-binding CsgD family transcriptional regulator/type II secretory pathway predicted ATPase ExeA